MWAPEHVLLSSYSAVLTMHAFLPCCVNSEYTGSLTPLPRKGKLPSIYICIVNSWLWLLHSHLFMYSHTVFSNKPENKRLASWFLDCHSLWKSHHKNSSYTKSSQIRPLTLALTVDPISLHENIWLTYVHRFFAQKVHQTVYCLYGDLICLFFSSFW